MNGSQNKIWFFGASNTTYWNSKIKWTNDYIAYKGYIPKHFTELLSEKLNLIPINKAIGAIDNYTIFETIIKNIDNIGINDKIVVDWVSPLRFRIIENNKFKTIIANHTSYNGELSNNTIDEILVNRDNKLYTDEILHWTNLLIKLYKKNIIFWTDFNEFNLYPHIIKMYDIKSPIRIVEETSAFLDDPHYGEIGHSMLADVLYDAFALNKLI